MSSPRAAPCAGLVGYLVSEYPAPSHTFIRREIEALRGAGVAIRTYSVRTPGHPFGDGCGRSASEETFCILATAPLRVVLINLAAMVRRPGRFFSTLVLAMRHRVPGVRALVWALFHFAEAIVLADRLRSDRIERLHNHFANSGATVGLLAANFNEIPWSLTLHGISEFDYPAGNLLPDKLERADFAVCASYFGMAQAMRLTDPRLWPKLQVVRCALDPRQLPASRNSAQGRITRIICVGRLSPEKGHVGLLRAMQGLAARGIAVRLILVGDGPQHDLLKVEARKLGIANDIEFLGALDEPSTLLAISASDILVLPSFMEGLPIVLMEAMALRVPVVASRVAGIPELVVDGETGLLFDPANWDGLTQALCRLATDHDLRERLIEGGYLKVSTHFFYPGAVLPLERLLREGGRNAPQIGIRAP
jgi:glycosyltransferase involved in cell wall biosynthesis